VAGRQDAGVPRSDCVTCVIQLNVYKAFFVPGYWWRSTTYSHANKVIDDIFTSLTATSATTPVLTGIE